MSVSVGDNRYGKEGVRLVRVRRSPYNGNTFDEWTVRVLIEGDFVSSYSEADNSKVLPTDTMKNTVYYLAARTKTSSMEDFGKELANYLLENHNQVSVVHIDIARKAWSNIIMSNNTRHPTSYVQSGNDLEVTTITRPRHGPFKIVSGLQDLCVMKTAHSAFVKFYKDKLTTLPDASDRLFGTAIKASWSYDCDSMDFDKVRQQIRSLIIDMFAEHHSESVQHTIHAIGQYVLDNVKCVQQISMTLPNIHCIPVDLTRFGEENRNEIFMPIDDPHGYIQCTINRSNMNKNNVVSKL